MHHCVTGGTQVQGVANGEDVWIGLSDRNNEGSFVWENTGQAPGYKRWDSGIYSFPYLIRLGTVFSMAVG